MEIKLILTELRFFKLTNFLAAFTLWDSQQMDRILLRTVQL